MAVNERLSIEEINTETLLASEHVHRYEFAANLCEGLRIVDLCCGSGYGSLILQRSARSVIGVDVDVATIEAAARMDAPIEFVAGDAYAYLRTVSAADVDALVCFEGLEHVPNLDDVAAELARLAAEGVALVLTIPNSHMWDEVNEFHLTDFSFDTAIELFRRIGAQSVLVQQFAEGSVIVDPSAPHRPESAPLRWPERVEPDYANHVIGVANVESERVAAALSGRLAVAAAPAYNRHIRNIERANADLWRANARLGRDAFALSGAAAAVRNSRTEEQVAERTAELSERIQELEARLRTSEDARLAIDRMLADYIAQAQRRAKRPARRVAVLVARAAVRATGRGR